MIYHCLRIFQTLEFFSTKNNGLKWLELLQNMLLICLKHHLKKGFLHFLTLILKTDKVKGRNRNNRLEMALNKKLQLKKEKKILLMADMLEEIDNHLILQAMNSLI